eukprot:COSAG05_NODE_2708_length_2743_cov_6.270424_2_plen_58_part_01
MNIPLASSNSRSNQYSSKSALGLPSMIPCLTNVTASLLGEQFVDTICLEAGRGLPIEL